MLQQIKDRYLSKQALLVVLMLPAVIPGFARADKMETHIGVGLNKFNYTEYNDNNIFLDGETGVIPGLILSMKKEKTKNYTEFVGSFYGSVINYDGQTQGGTPLKTRSDAVILDGHFKSGYKLENNKDYYLGLGYRYWYRNIRPGRDSNGNPVAGLLEEYSWPYLLLGFQSNLMQASATEVNLDIRYTHMLNAKMSIDFLGYCNYDNAEVDLGNRNGWRFALPVKKKLGSANVLLITPYYEIIDIGKSNTVALTRNGALVDCNSDGFYDGALEPRSETRNFGIEFTWLW